MTRKSLALSVFAVAFAFGGPSALACNDRTDLVVQKVRKADLTTEQLKSIFQYQKEHRDLITKAHAEGLGCSHHENRVVDFEKASFGVLTDEQFQKVAGRVRNDEEKLRYENYLLKMEIARLKQELEALKKEPGAPSKN